MLILPAIDLLDGRCVRLNQGRFDDATVYSDDPLAVAREFVASGAESTRSPDQVVGEMKALGVRWVVCTDVRRAGLQTGPSTSLTAQRVAQGFDLIAAAGISSVEDVARVRETGAAGCIIGRALYTGAVSLPEAMEAARAD